MFGWEFPPFCSGGLGTACFGLTKGLCKKGVDVTFIVPTRHNNKQSHVKLVSSDLPEYSDCGSVNLRYVKSFISPYMTQKEYELKIKRVVEKMSLRKGPDIYGSNLFAEVVQYAKKASVIASREDFDIIHCHDWMTYGAGIAAKRYSGKPLVMHIHATEFDRTGGQPGKYVFELEQKGFQEADRIIAVSNYTKEKVVCHYGISPDKIEVVHNAVFSDGNSSGSVRSRKKQKTVLFLGRVTIQKGPDYFLKAAKKVLEYEPDTRFVVAGSGDMIYDSVNLAKDLGIENSVEFTGFLVGNEVKKAYQEADLYVMPSISEPFGIAPLEAMSNGTPVIISKQSGVSEVISHCLKVDFWDIDQMANKIITVLRHSELKSCLAENGFSESKNFSWDSSAAKCVDVYKKLVGDV